VPPISVEDLLDELLNFPAASRVHFQTLYTELGGVVSIYRDSGDVVVVLDTARSEEDSQ
jgi:hypothetical protein